MSGRLSGPSRPGRNSFTQQRFVAVASARCRRGFTVTKQHLVRALLTLVTGVFEKFVVVGIRADESRRQRPWPSVDGGILDPHLIVEGIRRNASEAFDEVHAITIKIAHHIEPGLTV